ncbi:hypothetical protein PIB30_008878 [Stylosanthes scabra]|uniref:Uncharacterized protein n=1 Tax=Stylosanthes scabra TaxID=79078 RepID=A0ABU6Z4S9_9FABA|nr:hypothetical protein [Stylosanthes scabra]
MGRDRDVIWFRSSTPVVFQMYPVVTLKELKSVILRNMGLGAVGTSAYPRLLGVRLAQTVCSPIKCPAPEVPMLMDANSGEDSDEEFVSNVEESSESSNGSEFVLESQSRTGFLLPAPVPIPDLSYVNIHFHTLHLEDMDEEPMEGFGVDQGTALPCPTAAADNAPGNPAYTLQQGPHPYGDPGGMPHPTE